jgi:hypothetical protein
MTRPPFLRRALLAGSVLQRKIRCRSICTALLALSALSFVACLIRVLSIGPIDLLTLGWAAAAAAAFVSRFE